MGNIVTIYGPSGTWGTRAFNMANHLPMALIAGPCQIEGLDHALFTASFLAAECERLGIPFIYKSSYDKANRTRGDTPRGPGIVEGLRILEEVRAQVGCPVTTDVHSVDEAYTAALVVDVVQIPAFLSRQTDIIHAAGEYAKAVSIKKHQSASPAHWAHGAVNKADNPNTILIERGTTFGYGVVNDFVHWPMMRRVAPVVFDATHSVQSPSSLGSVSGGDRDKVPDLAAAAIAVGIAGIFIECHEHPEKAPSDGPCMTRLVDMPGLLNRLKRIDEVVKSYPA